MSFSNDWSTSVDPFDLVILIAHPIALGYITLSAKTQCLFAVVCFLFVCTSYLFVICLVICDRFVQKPCAHFEMCSEEFGSNVGIPTLLQPCRKRDRALYTRERARKRPIRKPRNRFPRCGIMDDEYRLAWANIEGWTTNANPPRSPAIYPRYASSRRKSR
jgi:hypothetical protein